MGGSEIGSKESLVCGDLRQTLSPLPLLLPPPPLFLLLLRSDQIRLAWVLFFNIIVSGRKEKFFAKLS